MLKRWNNLRLLSLLLLTFSSTQAAALEFIRSSVSPEFPDGLHAKYLRYIAEQMQLKIDIVPMPFARRIVALTSGQIDIMVGMQRENDQEDKVIYLFPSYETLRHSFFIMKDRGIQLNDFADLSKLNIGVTIHAKYYQRFHDQADLALISVSTLEQKVNLLSKGRIDTFIHYEHSAVAYLQHHNLQDTIVLAPYQPTEYNEYFVTISAQSQLFPYQEKLQAIIRAGHDNGDFARIRAQHYQLSTD
ncbi:MAG: transporter substrate-binding domain-containing protein [Paraglaciecola sp.]|nr:transporter substrate-binding domain-containing protein [Paraglaciecola sp.]NCT47997.1 transporter substrate-binding domain-containing protein [Paraglaciecola sp.]